MRAAPFSNKGVIGFAQAAGIQPERDRHRRGEVERVVVGDDDHIVAAVEIKATIDAARHPVGRTVHIGEGAVVVIAGGVGSGGAGGFIEAPVPDQAGGGHGAAGGRGVLDDGAHINPVRTVAVLHDGVDVVVIDFTGDAIGVGAGGGRYGGVVVKIDDLRPAQSAVVDAHFVVGAVCGQGGRAAAVTAAEIEAVIAEIARGIEADRPGRGCLQNAIDIKICFAACRLARVVNKGQEMPCRGRGRGITSDIVIACVAPEAGGDLAVAAGRVIAPGHYIACGCGVEVVRAFEQSCHRAGGPGAVDPHGYGDVVGRGEVDIIVPDAVVHAIEKQRVAEMAAAHLPCRAVEKCSGLGATRRVRSRCAGGFIQRPVLHEASGRRARIICALGPHIDPVGGVAVLHDGFIFVVEHHARMRGVAGQVIAGIGVKRGDVGIGQAAIVNADLVNFAVEIFSSAGGAANPVARTCASPAMVEK